MYLKGTILSLGLLCLIAAARSQPQCAFSFPSVMKSGETSSVCFEIKRNQEPVKVEIMIEDAGVNHTVCSKQVSVQETFNCHEFQVPEISSPAPRFLIMSATATNFTYTQMRPVVIAPIGNITLMLLERSIYKPEQTVRAKVIAMDNDLRSVEEMYTSISVLDPSGNRLYHWKNQQTENGIVDLTFEISDEPELGDCVIQVLTESGRTISKSFTVDKYVMPKFDAKIEAPNIVTTMDKTLSLTTSGWYTFGQPLSATVAVKACRPPANYNRGNACNRNPDGLCIHYTGELDANGTYTKELDMSKFQPDRSGYAMLIKIQVAMTEAGTGIQRTATKSISITNQLGMVNFNYKNMEQHYKKGIPYSMEATAVDGVGKPLSNQTLVLLIDGVPEQNLTTDANGKVQYFIDTNKLEQSAVSLQINYKTSEECYDSTYVMPVYSSDFYTIIRFYSKNECFVQMERPKDELQCGQLHTLKAKYIFNQSGLQEGETSVNLNYVIMSRAQIVKHGSVPADLTKSLQGEVSFTVAVTADHAPGMDVVMYGLLKDEVVTHTMRLNVEKCFKNQVSMNFSEASVAPGSTVNMNIASAPNSTCCARVLDASLKLLKQDQPLTAEMVYASMLFKSLTGYYAEGYDVTPPHSPCTNAKRRKIEGIYFEPVESMTEGDASEEFNRVGMIVVTDVSLNQPTLCGHSFPTRGQPTAWDGAGGLAMEAPSAFARMPGVAGDMVASDFSGSLEGAPAEIATERSTFPAAWVFIHIPTGPEGSASVPLKAPGTITGWDGDLVCMNSHEGLGMSKQTAKITTFQEFFADSSLAYSCIQGETITPRVTVSNYMKKCAKVTATIADSEDYTVEATKENRIQCICSGQRASFSFIMKPKSIGWMSVSIIGETIEIADTCDSPADPTEPKRKDTMVKSIIVEPPGIPQEATKSTFICAEDKDVVTKVNVLPPENAVEGATKLQFSAIGEILGNAIDKPESMITDPAGCTEQLLASIMATVMVVPYLNVTDRLTPEMKAKAIEYMGKGYRKLLPSKNRDGSFSIFPRGPDNSWLTLKVLDCFENMRQYIDIDNRIGEQGILYIESLFNKKTGGFTPKGKMFNNALKDGAEDVSFTAAVAMFLMKTSYGTSMTLLRQVSNFLNAASEREQSLYNMAMLFCFFRMAGNDERSKAMFEKLKKYQKEEGGTISWERLNKPSQSAYSVFPPQAPSPEIEITSKMLYGSVIGPLQPMDLNYVAPMALWLSRQQRSAGSFSNTMDSVSAVEAMSAYGALVYQKDANNAVQVKNGDEVVKAFNLGPEHRNLMQTHSVKNTAGEYEITVSGNGCVLVQTTLIYNIPVKKENSAFDLSVYTPPESCVSGVAWTFPVNINFTYNGPRNETNMVLVDLLMPSGYGPEQESLAKLRTKVPKVEHKNNHLIIYLKSATRNTTSLSVVLEMGQMVQNWQPTHCYIWDYYAKEENGVAAIYHPCSRQ